jgi:glycosyltransferase involved in cell wall biosynthesis
MLVANPWRIDSRVIREATALSQAGHDVHVISDDGGKEFKVVEKDGVTYHCLSTANTRTLIALLPRIIFLHWGVQFARIEDMASTAGYLAAALHGFFLVFQILFATIALVVGGILLGIVSVLPFLVSRIARTLSTALRTINPRYEGGNGTLREIYVFLARGVNWFVQKLWSATFRVLGMAGTDSIRYLNQFGARAFDIGCSLKPDVVHSHDLVTLSAGHAIAHRMGVPLIYDAHELETHTNYWGLSKAIRYQIEVYERTLIRRTNAVITVCESIADWLRDNYDIPRPTVIHNSPDFTALPEAGTSNRTLRLALGLTSGVPLAVYVGSVTIDRGIEQCVEALAYAPALHMAFVGPRYSETEKQIWTISQRLGVESRVHLVDPVPSAEVTKFISDADCSVMAIQNVCLSYYFCFPNKLLESVLAGVPVVAARLIELERFVERFRVGLIADETNPKALAQAMKTIIQQKANFLPSATTRSEIVKMYGWAAQRARLLALYARLTEQGIDIPKKLTGRRDQAMSRANQSQNGA